VLLSVTSINPNSTLWAQSARSAALEQTKRVEFLDDAVREPMIVEHPNGTLFVTGYGQSGDGTPQTVPRLWQSLDHGATWQRVNVGTEADGASANSDVDLALAPDGTLYLISMWFDLKTDEGTHIVVGASTDVGKTWRWTMVSKMRFDDRPWVAVAPDGTAHVIWNNGSVYHRMSRDRGQTWTTAEQIHPQGGSSHLAVGPKGEVAVRILPVSASGNKFNDGVDLLAISTDGGKTWQKRSVPGVRDWAFRAPGETPRWVEPLAWDENDSLYLLWTQVGGVWLGRSQDDGATWTKWRIAASEGDTLPYFPYLTAHGRGELAGAWHLGVGSNLRWQVCRIQIDSGAEPHTTCSNPLELDTWTKGDPEHEIAPERSTGGEYLPVLFLRNGELAVATPIQNSAAKRFGFTFWKFK